MLRLVGQVSGRAARAVVPVMAGGREASSGLVEVQMRSGSYGSVCGMKRCFWRCKPFVMWPVWEWQLVWGERLVCACKARLLQARVGAGGRNGGPGLRRIGDECAARKALVAAAAH